MKTNADLYEYLFTDVSHAFNMTRCHSDVISHATCHSEVRSAEESLETILTDVSLLRCSMFTDENGMFVKTKKRTF